MKKILTNEEFLNYLNKESFIYKCPICKKRNWVIFSKDLTDSDRIGSFGYAAYTFDKNGEDSELAELTSDLPVFAMAICQNCGFIATFDDEVIKNKIENQKKIK